MNFNNRLQKLDQHHQRRKLTPISGLDFTSNDYLAFAGAPFLKTAIEKALAQGTPVGSGASRLLRGNHPAHHNLETFAADFFDTERALYMANGFMGNYALLTTLPGRGDTIIYDQLCHASMRDGIHASHAKSIKVRHNDLTDFEVALKKANGQKYIVTEGIFSMDGDMAPVTDLITLAEKYNAYLILDEAHATGVIGAHGKGAAEGLNSPNLITLHTCGKALGAEGALICANSDVIELLINTARPFIYSTAPSPLMAAAAHASLQQLKEHPQKVTELQHLIQYARKLLAPYGANTQQSSAIIPLIIGDNAKTMQLAEALQNKGFDIRGIRPPTVPAGTARLRLTVTLHQTEKDWQNCAVALAEII